jgi:hypothetical protein
MQDEQKQRRLKAATLPASRAELKHLRNSILASSSTEDLTRLKALKTKVREGERRDAIIWRRRSRIRWLSVGEAPSKYFFAQMRGKHLRDTIHTLRHGENEAVTTDKELIQTIYDNFSTTFATDPVIRENREERDSILARLEGRVTAEENLELLRVPEDKEI